MFLVGIHSPVERVPCTWITNHWLISLYTLSWTYFWDAQKKRLRTTPCALQKVNFFQNLAYHAKLARSVGWNDTEASRRPFCDPCYSSTGPKRDVGFTGKRLVSSSQLCTRVGSLSSAHCNNGFPVDWSDSGWGHSNTNWILWKKCGPMLLAFHVPIYAAPSGLPINSNSINRPWVHIDCERPSSYYSHPFVRVGHTLKFAIKPHFCCELRQFMCF